MRAELAARTHQMLHKQRAVPFHTIAGTRDLNVDEPREYRAGFSLTVTSLLQIEEACTNTIAIIRGFSVKQALAALGSRATRNC